MPAFKVENEAKMQTKKMKKLVAKITDRKNLVWVPKEDVEKLLKLGNEIRFTPKKNARAKGALICVEGGPKMTLSDIHNIGDRITKPLPKNAEIIWTAKVTANKKSTSVDVVYVY